MQTIQQNKIGRNDPCSCGSRLKFKKCCLEKRVSNKNNIDDENKNIRLINYKITYDPLPSPELDFMTKEDRKIYDNIYEKMFSRFCKYEQCLLELENLKIKYPNICRIYNLLSVCYERTFQKEKAYNMLFEQNEKFPDYLFAKMNLCNHFLAINQHKRIYEILNGNFDLQSLYPKKEVFHINEFARFTAIFASYFAREGEIETAKIYLNILLKLHDCKPSIRIIKNEIEKQLNKNKKGVFSVFKESIFS